MKKFKWMVGDLFQLSPDYENKPFASCIMTVAEVKSWGVLAYVEVPSATKGQAYLRVNFDDMWFCGRAHFVVSNSEGEEKIGKEESL